MGFRVAFGPALSSRRKAPANVDEDDAEDEATDVVEAAEADDGVVEFDAASAAVAFVAW